MLGFCVSSGNPSKLAAATFEVGGLAFSAELGCFRLISVHGSSHAADPIIIAEKMDGLGPAVLTIRHGDVQRPASPSSGVLLRSLVKLVINRNAWHRSGFDLEPS